MKTLTSGVYLHLLPEKKYKTIRINIRFSQVLREDNSTLRTLLASVLETNAKNYPTQRHVSQVLADLYGASFGINVGKKGTRHIVTVSMNLVNDKFLTEKNITQKAISFLKEMLFAPNITNDLFHEETFLREKENLLSYLKSVYEDKQTYSSLELQKLYFKDPAQGIPSFGLKEQLEKVTNAQLVEAYTEMIEEDKVDILVVGDVTEEEMVSLFSEFPFKEREEAIEKVTYQQEFSPVIREKQERQEISQAKLNLAYRVKSSSVSEDYFTAVIFNGLFGGFPHSKLFLNVREKESLAYYASSSLDTFRSYLSVQTGIEGKNRDHVLHLITEQLESLQRGEISDLELLQTKANLKNQFLMTQDSPQGQMELYFRQVFLNECITEEMWLKKLEAVTVEDVSQYAKDVRLESIYFLEGVTYEN